mgnify:CR=1 FL=1
MIKSFKVKNYKLFKDFFIEGFQRINLITGRNNVGKTSLLEALFIHSGAVNIQLPFSTEIFRGVAQFQGAIDSACAGFFFDFNTVEPIVLESEDKLDLKRVVVLRIVPVSVTIGGKEIEEQPPSVGQALEISFIEPGMKEAISSKAIRERNELRLEPPPRGPLFEAVFVHTRAADHKTDAGRYSELVKNIGEEEQFINALRAIEPAVRGARLLQHGGAPMIHVDIGAKKFLPLPYAGEGMVRLARILVAIGQSRNGMVLIDEFENGLYYSVIPKVWRAIIEFADRYNVQVFATTHSKENIEAAHRVFSEMEYRFRLFRLDSSADGIQAFAYDKEALEHLIKSEFEAR